MKTALKSLALCAAWCALQVGSGSPAWAWGGDGHEITGHAAEFYLKKTVAGRQALQDAQAILAPGETLANAANWADRIKGGSFDEDSRDFLGEAANANHRNWHFVNLPFQTEEYKLGEIGTNATDIVQMSAVCIKVLQGQSTRFKKREALRLLIHYIGDMHQPLHVGCGYVQQTSVGLQFVVPSGDQNDFHKPTSDRGGNSLLLSRSKNLHSHWDSQMVNRASHGRSPRQEASHLVGQHPNGNPMWVLFGDDAATWPKQMADDALAASRLAYRDISLVEPQGEKWRISKPSNYDATREELTESQLAKAGYRLNLLLQSIFSH